MDPCAEMTLAILVHLGIITEPKAKEILHRLHSDESLETMQEIIEALK